MLQSFGLVLVQHCTATHCKLTMPATYWLESREPLFYWSCLVVNSFRETFHCVFLSLRVPVDAAGPKNSVSEY